jgi:curved DNA-binding protein CbpA
VTASDFWVRAQALAGSLDAISYYAVLEVAATASVDDVRAAYAKRLAEFHPDRHAQERDPERKRVLVSIQARLNEAYRALSRADRRAAYDRALAGGDVRLVGKPTAAPRRETTRTPRGRLYFESGNEREQLGDLAGARLQYGLAIQVEPDSTAIQEALARVSPVAPAPAPTPDARDHTRHPFSKPVRLQCRSWEHLITLNARNLSRSGIFVKTASPLEVGATVEVQLGLPDGRTLSLPSEVARVVAPERADPREPAGMALRFLPMNDELRRVFDEALAAAAAQTEAAAPPERSPPRVTSTDPVEESVLRDVQADVARMREGRRHDVLAIRADASPAEIRTAYVQLARRHHPDLFARYRSALVVDAAIDAVTLLRQAYEQMLAAATAGGTP